MGNSHIPWLVLLAGAAALAGCVPAAAWPRVVSTIDVRSRPVPAGDWITDYDTALATIAATMRRDLGLPLGEASLIFYRNREAFADALRASGYDDQLAADSARTLAAIGGFRRVLLNDDLVSDLEWPNRVALLAHELTHTLQYEVGGGRRGSSEQWLREGFAEWVEVEVLVVLGFTTRDAARAIARRRVAAARSLPSLQEMVTFPEWVRMAQQSGTDAIYAQAMLAAGLLVERHGAPALVAYFERFGVSGDRLANFRLAFGEDLPAFEQRFNAYLDSAVR